MIHVVAVSEAQIYEALIPVSCPVEKSVGNLGQEQGISTIPLHLGRRIHWLVDLYLLLILWKMFVAVGLRKAAELGS